MPRSALFAAVSFVLFGAAASHAALPAICQIRPHSCIPGPVILPPILDVAVDPTAIDFGSVEVGTTSPTIQVRVINVGSAPYPVHLFGKSFGGEFSATQTCGLDTLPVGGSCAFNYTFSPPAAGTFTTVASFTVSPTSNRNDGEDFSVDLSGTGVSTGGPGVVPIAVDPVSVDFGEVLVGATASVSVNVKSTSLSGFGPLHVFAGDPTTAEFSFSEDCQGTTLPGLGTCTITYSFSP